MPRNSYSPKSKFWCFTLNNPRSTEKEDLFDDVRNNITFSVWQLEAGEMDTQHIQGYVILKDHRDLIQLKRNILTRETHAEVARGSPLDNFNYCTKDDTRVDGPWQVGELPQPAQGKRTDLLEVKEKLDGGFQEKEIADAHFGSWVRYHKSFTAYTHLSSVKRDWKTQVIVLIGPSQIGKSYFARHHTDNGFEAFHGSWFDGYNGKDDLIINDYPAWNKRDPFMPLRQLLQLCDEGPYTIQYKGGVINFAPRRLIITSNVDITRWFDWAETGVNPFTLTRRIEYLHDVSLEAKEGEVFFNDEWYENNSFEDIYPTRPSTPLHCEEEFPADDEVGSDDLLPLPEAKRRRCVFIADEADCDESLDDENSETFDNEQDEDKFY